MICVGIDAASQKHDICIMNHDGEVFKRIFTIKNSKSEYKKLLNEIEAAKKFWEDSKVCIGIESTGVYSETLIDYLSKIEAYEIIYINPILTNMFQHSEVIHYAKTDKIDAKGICLFLFDKHKRLYTYTRPSYTILEMKSLGREMDHLNKMITKTSNHLTGLLHIVFPEIFNVFNKVKHKTCLEYLKLYPTPDMVVHKRNLNIVSKNVGPGGRIESDINDLIRYAKETIGKYSKSDAIIVYSLAQQLSFLYQQKEMMIERMDDVVHENYKHLLSIPGMGPITACTIIGEIGNITNFHGAGSLVAYAGINPMVYESGNYKATSLSMSKKGSSYLRNAIITVSRLIIFHDETFKRYFDKKIAEGKHYNVAIGHVSNKLTRVIYRILKYGENYQSVTQ